MPNWTHDTSYEGDDTEAVLWTVLTLIIAFAFAAIALILFEGLCAPPPSTFERVAFYTIIAMIFVETAFAGWYRVRD